MIARLIGWSARNLVLVLIGTVFAVAAGLYAVRTLPLDAIPDLSDVQAIVYTEYPGQAPQVVEDQVTYPLTTAMLTVPKSKVVRGFSFFGVSFVYVIFEDGTDPYWARSRVLEYLNAAGSKLPSGVTPTLGPDATGVGWVYQYAIVAKQRTLAELRSLQDWVVRFGASRAEGVAEVAGVGGFVKQYNVVVDPNRLRAQGISLDKLREAIRSSNADVGGRTVELSEFEFMVRGRGYIRSVADIENIVLKTEAGTPLRVRDVARVEIGPDERRGITELNGEGEVAGGIVLQRFGANALSVIEGVKAKLAEVAKSLPAGTEILPVYDRSQLIEAAIHTLRHTLVEESAIVALVCVVFLLHLRSALVAILMLPVGILMALAAMRLLGIGANIMSLGGIAIAVGAMIDAAIVMIENAHKHLERAPPGKPRVEILVDAASEVGPSLFFSLLVITVSFLPIFTLENQEGRLFGPLAFTKTFSMAAAALLSVTLVPALMVLFVRGRIVPEHRNPVNRLLIWVYRPVIKGVLRAKVLTILLAVVALGLTIWPARQLGSEFMPDLNEGTLMYMPTTLPGISVTKAGELLATQDRIIKSFPEVASVYGKAGRASTATDPAPMEMFETIIRLKPQNEWRPGVTLASLKSEMDKALQFPGVSNAWTQPIRARIDMLSTGIRTPVGIKVYGKDLAEMEKVAREVEAVVRTVPGTSSAYAERVIGGYFLDITPDREALGRYGLMIGDVQDVIATALGGQSVTNTVEGRERYTVNVRYPRAYRSNPQTIATDVQVPLPGGGTVPLGEVAKVQLTRGPTSIRTENGQLAVYIFVDISGRDLGGYVADARVAVDREVKLPQGMSVQWSGQFEYLERAEARLKIVVPVTLLIIFLLLYLNFRRLTETLIVMLSLPFSLVGGVWLMWWMGFNMSVAVAVGFIALAGVAAETGVIMLIPITPGTRCGRRSSPRAGCRRARTCTGRS
jgi:copper/silver efflux system protein